MHGLHRYLSYNCMRNSINRWCLDIWTELIDSALTFFVWTWTKEIWKYVCDTINFRVNPCVYLYCCQKKLLMCVQCSSKITEYMYPLPSHWNLTNTPLIQLQNNINVLGGINLTVTATITHIYEYTFVYRIMSGQTVHWWHKHRDVVFNEKWRTSAIGFPHCAGSGEGYFKC
jgi:hypothetical protein